MHARNNIKKEEETPMSTDKKMCLHCGKEPAYCRGLGPKCWYKWRHGKIAHPTEGKWTVSPKHVKKIQNIKKERSAIRATASETVKEVVKEVTAFPSPLIEKPICKLREKLKDCKILCQAMQLCGDTRAEKEIEFWLKDFM